MISTTLTGTDLDISLMLAAGSGMEKLAGGLSLITTCGTSQVLKWSGSAWACGNDNGGISYTAGSGITISGSVISSVLGADITSNEIVDGTILAQDIANGAITFNKIQDIGPNSLFGNPTSTILYRSSEDRLIEVAPISIDPQASPTNSDKEPALEPTKDK